MNSIDTHSHLIILDKIADVVELVFCGKGALSCIIHNGHVMAECFRLKKGLH